MMAFSQDSVRGNAEALLLCQYPDGRQALHIYEGINCKLDWLSLESDIPGTVSVIKAQEGISGRSAGPARTLRVSSALLKGKTTVRVNGNSVDSARTENTVVFTVPAGSCEFDFR